MTYLLEALEKPARIYHKQCSHCGLNYMGKTSVDDIENYPGSGKHWQRHLQKYNAKSIHVWNSDWFYDNSIVDYALDLSIKYNIVESKDWANLKEENGLDGGDPGCLGREKISKTLKEYYKTSEGVKTRQNAALKNSNIMQDKKWKETIGAQRIKKQLSTKQSKEYKEKNSRKCEHCGWYGDVGNYNKLHGKNCKSINPLRHEKLNEKSRYNLQNIKNIKIKCENCGGVYNLPNYKQWHGDKCNINRAFNGGNQYVKCEFCDIQTNKGNYSRWHGDKCKKK
jgi:hypothetical protein